MTTSQIIKELCAYKKIPSKSEFAKIIGTTPQNINGWEERNTLDLHKICKAFPDVDANWLITGEGNMLKRPIIEGGVANGEGAMNHANSNIIIEKFMNEIAEQRKVTQSVLEQNSTLISIIKGNEQNCSH